MVVIYNKQSTVKRGRGASKVVDYNIKEKGFTLSRSYSLECYFLLQVLCLFQKIDWFAISITQVTIRISFSYFLVQEYLDINIDLIIPAYNLL